MHMYVVCISIVDIVAHHLSHISRCDHIHYNFLSRLSLLMRMYISSDARVSVYIVKKNIKHDNPNEIKHLNIILDF